MIKELEHIKEEIVIQSQFIAPYHYLQFEEPLTQQSFKEFINWLDGEFDLFLKEKLKNSLHIYFPNGKIEVAWSPKNKLVVLVKNKNSRSCKKMIGHIQKIFFQFKTIKH